MAKVAGVVVVLYDALLSLAKEIDLVWAPLFQKNHTNTTKGTFSLSKFMYLFSRFAIMGIALQFLSGGYGIELPWVFLYQSKLFHRHHTFEKSVKYMGEQ